ncbi:MAG: hypothetical protein JXX28_14170 [Deltaproteobacteria bacterium]|nr:hypothetical protein [Deltaproteobacteria bacterium]
MLQLTLYSSEDGKFLARIVDRGTRAFVLDYGVPQVIGDAAQRVQHGFTMWQHGQLISAHPEDPHLLRHLAAFYANEGMLVFFEEPDWPGRADDESSVELQPGLQVLRGRDEDEHNEALEDGDTELLSLADLPDASDALEQDLELDELLDAPLRDLGDEDLLTEERPWLEQKMREREATRLPDLGAGDLPTELLGEEAELGGGDLPTEILGPDDED